MDNYDEFGINIKNKPMLFRETGIESAKVNPKMMAIRAFTSTNYFRQLLYHLKGFKLIKLKDDKLRLEYKDDIIEFIKFTSILLDKDESMKIIKKELLNYKKRKGKCHSHSLAFINAGTGDFLVTGYVNDSKGKVRIIHSWIEKDQNVIDYTSNLVIRKDDYYDLMDVEVLSVISSEEVKNDLVYGFTKSLCCKFYCLFRQELKGDGLLEETPKIIKKIK